MFPRLNSGVVFSNLPDQHYTFLIKFWYFRLLTLQSRFGCSTTKEAKPLAGCLDKIGNTFYLLCMLERQWSKRSKGFGSENFS